MWKFRDICCLKCDLYFAYDSLPVFFYFIRCSNVIMSDSVSEPSSSMETEVDSNGENRQKRKSSHDVEVNNLYFDPASVFKLISHLIGNTTIPRFSDR